MNGDSDRRESSERNPQVNPTKLDNSEALNLSCSDGPRGRQSLKVTIHKKMQGKQFLHVKVIHVYAEG